MELCLNLTICTVSDLQIQTSDLTTMPPKKAGKGAKMVAEPSKEKKKKGAKSGKKRKESYAIYIYKVSPKLI